MNLRSFRVLRFFLIPVTVVVFGLPSPAETPSSWGQSAGRYALTNAKILIAPGQTVEKGTILIEGPKILAVGADVAVPPGTRVIDVSGKVVHAGFLDPYVNVGRFLGDEESDGAPQLPERVHDERRVSETIGLEADAFDEFRQLGFVNVALVPDQGIFRGQSALYSTAPSEDPSETNLIDPSVASVVAFEPLGWEKLDGQNYPLSLMGNVAFVRQHFLDSAWLADQASPTDTVEMRASLKSLNEVRTGLRPLVFQASSLLDSLRIPVLVEEVGARPASLTLVLSGGEWQQLEWLKASSLAHPIRYIMPLAFPDTPEDEPGHPASDWTLMALRQWHAAPGLPAWMEDEKLAFALTTFGVKDLADWEARVQDAIAAGLSPERALAALTVEPASYLGLDDQGTLRPGMTASFVVRDGLPFSGKSTVEEVFIEGKRYPRFEGVAGTKLNDGKDIKARAFINKKDYISPPSAFATASSAPSTVLVRHATLWTQEPGGPLKDSDLLIQNGRIVRVGSGITAPPGALVIEGKGLHVTPGLIDAHSHTAVEGDVNEPGRNVTAMVRIKDVLNPFDHDIYLQLSSGVTAANVLHGSANAIGGQSITTRWKLGRPPLDMIFQDAPEGIKFALGENPKQSNWGDKHVTRYPQSRMGVVQLVRGSFESAKNYRRQKETGLNPQPDLALEALLEILDGKRLVHCHSYRQDEILALIRVAEEEGFKVNVFQHVLEGYKVADEIKAHGAAASTFADWWAYKVEVEDAIPQNASLMAERGVLVSINSDSPDLARRLNTEAGKSVRYGDMSEVDALSLITRNPAQQLGILERVGTLSPGKDADFAIWNAPPLSEEAICLETWIEGRRYFSRAEEARRVETLQKELKFLRDLAKKAEEKDE